MKVPVILRVKTKSREIKIEGNTQFLVFVSGLIILLRKYFEITPETKYEDYQRCVIFNEAVVFSLPASRQTEVPVSGAKKIITTCGTEE